MTISITSLSSNTGAMLQNGSNVFTINSSNQVSTTNDALVHGVTVGLGAGSVSNNTAVGASALAANTTGAYNVAVGQIALNSNTVGINNTAVGQASLQLNTTGTGNTGIGAAALQLNVSGVSNTAVGVSTLQKNTASGNCAFGSVSYTHLTLPTKA